MCLTGHLRVASFQIHPPLLITLSTWDDIKLYSRSQQKIESLIRKTVNIFFDDIRMSIGAAKCNIVSVHRGHLVESDSTVLCDIIHPLSSEGFYKYLGIFEADSFKHQQMKILLTKEYKRHFRKFLRTTLYSRNLITAINSCATSLLRYSGGLINWIQAEMRKMDIDTRKLMTMHGAFSMNGDVDRLYLSRKKEGRALISVKFAIEHE